MIPTRNPLSKCHSTLTPFMLLDSESHINAGVQPPPQAVRWNTASRPCRGNLAFLQMSWSFPAQVSCERIEMLKSAR